MLAVRYKSACGKAAWGPLFRFDQTSVASEQYASFVQRPRALRRFPGQFTNAWLRPEACQNLTKEHRVSKTWEHYDQAARHHEQAAYHYKEAAKYDEAEEHEKAAHHAYLAHGHNQHAIHHDAEAAKLHAEHCDSPAKPVTGKVAAKTSAA